MMYRILTLLILLRLIPDYLGYTQLYFMFDSILLSCISIYLFNESEKTVFSVVSLLCLLVLLFNQFIDNLLWIYDLDISYPYLPLLLKVFAGVALFLLIFKNRYTWRKQKSVSYNPTTVQAIYSKPKTILSLIGATMSFSPKCGVRYSYNGQTIQFKKSKDTPILEPTKFKGDEIIEDVDFDGDKFLARFDEIKDKKYNLRTFNCRSLIKW